MGSAMVTKKMTKEEFYQGIMESLPDGRACRQKLEKSLEGSPEAKFIDVAVGVYVHVRGRIPDFEVEIDKLRERYSRRDVAAVDCAVKLLKDNGFLYSLEGKPGTVKVVGAPECSDDIFEPPEEALGVE